MNRKLIERWLKQNGHANPSKFEVVNISRAYLNELFPAQLNIIQDPAKRKVLLAGRRYGKTKAIATGLVDASVNKTNANNVFIAKDLKTAKRLIYHEIKYIIDKYKIKAQYNATNMYFKFIKNNSYIYINSAKDLSECDKYRGSYYNMMAIDEIQSMGSYVEYLINDCVWPAMKDYGGQIIISGTPNPSATGYFYEATEGKYKDYWKCWRGTVFDNPKYPQWVGKSEIEKQNAMVVFWKELLSELGANENDPAIRREWYGEWVRHASTMVLPVINTYEELPNIKKKWHYVCGVDVGVVDQFAICVLAWSEALNQCFVVETWAQSGCSYQQMTSKLLELYGKYRFDVIAIDPSPGKILIQDLAAQHHLPCVAAKKVERLDNIIMMSEEFEANKVMVNAKLTNTISEWKELLWVEKADCEIKGILHTFDALLYAYRESQHFFMRIKPEIRVDVGEKHWDILDRRMKNDKK